MPTIISGFPSHRFNMTRYRCAFEDLRNLRLSDYIAVFNYLFFRFIHHNYSFFFTVNMRLQCAGYVI